MTVWEEARAAYSTSCGNNCVSGCVPTLAGRPLSSGASRRSTKRAPFLAPTTTDMADEREIDLDVCRSPDPVRGRRRREGPARRRHPSGADQIGSADSGAGQQRRAENSTKTFREQGLKTENRGPGAVAQNSGSRVAADCTDCPKLVQTAMRGSGPQLSLGLSH